MFVTKKVRRRITKVALILLILVLKSDAAEVTVQARNDENGGIDKIVAAEVHSSKVEDKENVLADSEDKSNGSKSDKSEQKLQVESVDNSMQNKNPEECKCQAIAPASQNQHEKVELSEQQSVDQEEHSDDAKIDEFSNASAPNQKKQTSKTEDENHKTSLSDVDSFSSEEEDGAQIGKREALGGEFLGVPRDASYFFDDLEPFASNNSDNRVGRAAPLHESKIQKVKFGGKDKDTIESELDEDEEDLDNEENEEPKVNEDDYEDDDENDEPDCQPTTSSSCSPSPTPTSACTTSSTCSTPTTCQTTKSTGVLECKTAPQCRTTTKGQKNFAKANRKSSSSIRPSEYIFNSELDKKKVYNKRRKFRNKLNSVQQPIT